MRTTASPAGLSALNPGLRPPPPPRSSSRPSDAIGPPGPPPCRFRIALPCSGCSAVATSARNSAAGTSCVVSESAKTTAAFQPGPLPYRFGILAGPPGNVLEQQAHDRSGRNVLTCGRTGNPARVVATGLLCVRNTCNHPCARAAFRRSKSSTPAVHHSDFYDRQQGGQRSRRSVVKHVQHRRISAARRFYQGV